MAIVSLRDVSFRYPLQSARCALEHLSLDVEAGSLVGVLGANGSGKSTLCGLLCGLVPGFTGGSLEGEIRLDGIAIADWQPGQLPRRLGYMFQNPLAQLSGIKGTVFDEVGFGLENLGVAPDAITSRVAAVCAEVGISDLLQRDPRRLSGGQTQLVALATVLAMEPALCVIDEPTSQLDPAAARHVFEVLGRTRDRGCSVVLVEHRVDLLAEYADRIVLLRSGRLVASGTVRDVLAAPTVERSGVLLPDVTQAALALRGRGHPLNPVPVAYDEAVRVFAGRLQ